MHTSFLSFIVKTSIQKIYIFWLKLSIHKVEGSIMKIGLFGEYVYPLTVWLPPANFALLPSTQLSEINCFTKIYILKIIKVGSKIEH